MPLCTGRKAVHAQTFRCLLVAGHPLYFKFTNVCFPPPLSLGNHRLQNPIITKWLPLLYHQLRPKSDISTDACKENCPCGETSNPPIVRRGLAVGPVGRINPGVHIFSPPVTTLFDWQQTVEDVSVLREGERRDGGRGGNQCVPRGCSCYFGSPVTATLRCTDRGQVLHGEDTGGPRRLP